MSKNPYIDVVEGFGDEWSRFDQSALSDDELRKMFDNYFNIFPWRSIRADAVGFDLGCGSGRWAKIAAARVGTLHVIDPSPQALEVARRNLRDTANCQLHLASVENIPLDADSCDFGYSLGVLHHVSDTTAGLRACVDKLKSGAPFLLYLYYRFDNRPFWYVGIWKLSDILRRFVSRMPTSLRYALSQVIAAAIYFPLARLALLLEKTGLKVEKFPLAQYRNNSFYVMRNDALDRFGTRVEKRFTKKEIREMMDAAGLKDISFSETSFWTAIGYKR